MRGNAGPPTWETFEDALRQYLMPPTEEARALATDISDPDFRVKVNVGMVEFLGRKAEKVVVDIDGWQDRQVSIVKRLQVRDDIVSPPLASGLKDVESCLRIRQLQLSALRRSIRQTLKDSVLHD